MKLVENKKAKELLDYMNKNFPEIKIAYKDEGVKNLLMYVILLYVKIMNLFIKDYEYKFMNNYTNVSGNYIYFSSRHKHPVSEYNMNYDTYLILRHEIIHLIQNKRNIFFKFNYLFLLPCVFTMRSKYEYEAYEEQMVAIFELYNVISDTTLERIASNFYGSMYFWMYPFKEKILSRLKETRKEIYKGKIKSKFLSEIKNF